MGQKLSSCMASKTASAAAAAPGAEPPSGSAGPAKATPTTYSAAAAGKAAAQPAAAATTNTATDQSPHWDLLQAAQPAEASSLDASVSEGAVKLEQVKLGDEIKQSTDKARVSTSSLRRLEGDSQEDSSEGFYEPAQEMATEPGTPDVLARDPQLPVGATPPPAAEDFPEVSLMDIMTSSSGKKHVSRSRSRRASNTSMASLSAIPENLELTPLNARADSVRHSLTPLDRSQSKNRDLLGEVSELDMESKSATMSRHSARHEASSDSSPRSSISSLLNGDDSIMPPDYEYQFLMPVLARPRAYRRQPNATEAIFGRAHSSSQGQIALNALIEGALPRQGGADAAAAVHASQELSTPARPDIATDDAGLRLLESTTLFDDGQADVELNEDQLRLLPVDSLEEIKYIPVQQGRVQQETIKLWLPDAVQGLRCVKKYQVGEIGWSQTVVMGDFAAGEHTYQFEESQVPKGTLSMGKYDMKTVFMDCHGQYLWAGLNNFEVVKKVVD